MRLRRSSLLRAGLAAFSALWIASCGGSGGGESSGNSAANSAEPATLKFTGTVAIGDALQNVIVTATCAGGTAGTSGPTNNQGRYALNVQGALPCTFKAVEPSTGFVLRSLSASDGTVNISPLTEAIYVFSNGDTAKLVAATNTMSVFMSSIGSPLSGDPIKQSFLPNRVGLDKNILDLTTYVNSNGSGTGAGSLAGLPAVFSAVAKNCGNEQRCILNESLLAKISSIEARDVGRQIFLELDKQLFLGGVNATYSEAWSPVVQALFEKGYKYAVASMIQTVGPEILKSAGVAKRVATSMADAFRSDAISPASLLKPTPGAALELFVSTGLGVFMEVLEDAIMPTLDLDGSWSDSFLAFFWGAASYSLEAAVKVATTCAFNQWRCSNAIGYDLVSLEALVSTTVSWIYKDAIAVKEVISLNADAAASDRRATAMQRLLDQVAAINHPEQVGARGWATTDGMAYSFASVLESRIQGFIGRLDAILDPLVTEPFKSQLTRRQLQRFDRARARWERIEVVCRSLKLAEEEVGISKCLNLMGAVPTASLSCPVGETLRNGVCNRALVLIPVVTDVGPLSGTLGQSVRITVTGTNLPVTMIVNIDGQSPGCTVISRTSTTSAQFSCALSVVGARIIRIQTDTLANGGTGIASNFGIFNVSPPQLIPTVSGIAPTAGGTAATVGVVTSFTINGSNLPSSLRISGNGCAGLPAITSNRTFSCSPSSTGQVTFTIADGSTNAAIGSAVVTVDSLVALPNGWCGQELNFDGGILPSNWSSSIFRGNAGLTNNRLEALAGGSSGVRVSAAPISMLPAVRTLVFEYTANHLRNVSGAQSGVDITRLNGDRWTFFVNNAFTTTNGYGENVMAFLVVRGNGLYAVAASQTTPDVTLLDERFSFQYGENRFRLEITSSTAKWTVTNVASNQSFVVNQVLPAALGIADISLAHHFVYTSGGAAVWSDNLKTSCLQ